MEYKGKEIGTNILRKKDKAIPFNRPWRPIGLWDVMAPTFSRQSTYSWQ
jgi:hypothetical protein